ncbi:cytochrome P450 [Streptomyces griseoruber]
MSPEDLTTRAEPEASYCPYPLYARLREQGAVFAEEADAFIVTRAEDVDTVLRDGETFSSRNSPGLPPIEPDSALGSALEETVFYLVRSDPPEHGRVAMRRFSEELLSFLGGSPDPVGFVRASKRFGAFLAPALEAAAGVEQETTILHAIAASGLDEKDATRFVIELLFAGNLTTTDAIANSVWILAEDPQLVDRLRQDPSLLATFIEESLRLETPVQGLYRTATRDTVLGGTPIPAGARILVSFGAGNRDAALADRPDEIDLDRNSPHSHLAFGRGQHTCLGNSLARLETRTALETLLGMVPRFELAVPSDRLDHQRDLNTRHLRSLPLRVHWS